VSNAIGVTRVMRGPLGVAVAMRGRIRGARRLRRRCAGHGLDDGIVAASRLVTASR
jgi:hypothetical protein